MMQISWSEPKIMKGLCKDFGVAVGILRGSLTEGPRRKKVFAASMH